MRRCRGHFHLCYAVVYDDDDSDVIDMSPGLSFVRAATAMQCYTRWPECSNGDYDPRCCRFPKSCSVGI